MADKLSTIEEDIERMTGVNEDKSDQNDEASNEETNESEEAADTKESDGVSSDRTGKSGKGDDNKGKKGQKADPSNTGDLFDDKGNIIARAGAERRIYEQAVAKAKKYDTEVPTLQEKLKALEMAANYREFGLDAASAVNAMKLFAAYTQDPAKTIKWLLTQAQAKGINIDLGQGAGGLSPEAVKGMIDEATKPIRETADREKQEQEQKAAAQKEYNDFVERFPDAVTQEGALAVLLQRNPSLSLDGAYYQLKLAFKERGLDWNKPLGEQVKNLQPKNGKDRSKPMLSGRMATGADELDDADDQKLASADASYDDIIRNELKRAGLN